MANTDNGKIRKRKSYTSISTYAILDDNLSAQACGVYTKIVALLEISNKDPNFIVYKNTVLKYMTNGTRSFNTAWKELKDKGYLKQYRIRTVDGFTYEYELLDEPDTSTPGTINVKFDGTVSSTSSSKKIDLNIEFDEDNEFNETAENTVESKGSQTNDSTSANEPTYQGFTRDQFTEIINKQIDYSALKSDEILYRHNTNDAIIDDIRNAIVDVYFSNSNSIRIHKEKQSINTVRSVFSKLNRQHIESAIFSIKEYIDKGNTINNACAFILTTLYDTYLSSGTKNYQEYG